MSWQSNPPAFPCEAQGDRSVPPEHDYIQTGIYSAKFPGMALRDWFAGQALPSVIMAMQRDYIGDHPDAGGGATGFAATAYDIADAMLVARAHAMQEGGSDA